MNFRLAKTGTRHNTTVILCAAALVLSACGSTESPGNDAFQCDPDVHEQALSPDVPEAFSSAPACPLDPGCLPDTGCDPDCTNRECGFEPNCLTSCGACDSGQECRDGVCETAGVGMVLIPGGAFRMGCDPAVDGECPENALAAREVTVPAFYIDRTEVTVSQYEACHAAGACSEPSFYWQDGNWKEPGRWNHPINSLNWFQARDFCQWAGKRLPSSAEWEKAARGTDGRRYPWGNAKPSCEYAVIVEYGKGCGTSGTLPVCSRSPSGDSPYGACDMAGNVAEWVSDWYSDNAAADDGTDDLSGPSCGVTRTVRGGEYYSGYVDSNLMTFGRIGYPPSGYNYYSGLGVRCASDELPSPQ